MGGLGHGPAFFFKAEPQQILRELDLCWQIVLIKCQRLFLVRGSLGEAVLLREFFADQMIHARIGFPVG